MQELSRKRDTDLVKTIAVFCVVCIHSCGNGYYCPLGSFDWVSTVFWGSVTRAGVPLFLMCSGALMLDPEKALPWKKLYGKNLLRLLLALFFWAAVYGIFRLSGEHKLNYTALRQLAKDLILFRHEQHLYFIHIMLLVYVLLPVTRILTSHATRRQLVYCLTVWFALGIVFPTVYPCWPFRLYSGIPSQWGLNMAWASVGYCMLGWYLRRYAGQHRPVFLLLLIAGLGATFGGTWFLSIKSGGFIQNLFSGMSVTVCLMAIGIYGLCLGSQPGKWTEFFSRASFCIYLSHMLFLLQFQKIPLTSQSAACIVSIPFLTLSVTGCGTVVYLILRKIPFINQWLI